MNWTALIIFGVIALVGFVAYLKIKKKVREVSNTLFQTDSITQGIKDINKKMEMTPKSLNSLESLELPRIHKDFPDFSVDDLKSKNIDKVYEFYNSIQKEDLGKFENDEQINDLLHSIIEKNKANNIKINEIHVHNQVIKRYEKSAQTATISFHVAFEYVESKEDDSRKVQERVITKWVYRLDSQNFSGDNITATKNCPNCGATIQGGEGAVVCPFCNSGIKVDYTRAWHFTHIEID